MKTFKGKRPRREKQIAHNRLSLEPPMAAASPLMQCFALKMIHFLGNLQNLQKRRVCLS